MSVDYAGGVIYQSVTPMQYRFLRLVWPGMDVPRRFNRKVIQKAIGCQGDLSGILTELCKAGVLVNLGEAMYGRTAVHAFSAMDTYTQQMVQCDLQLQGPQEGIEQYFIINNKVERAKLVAIAQEVVELTSDELKVACHVYPQLSLSRPRLIRVKEIAKTLGMEAPQIASHVFILSDKKVFYREKYNHRKGKHEVKLAESEEPVTIGDSTIQPGEMVNLAQIPLANAA